VAKESELPAGCRCVAAILVKSSLWVLTDSRLYSAGPVSDKSVYEWSAQIGELRLSRLDEISCGSAASGGFADARRRGR
jgi:hypothetical protein